MSEKFKPIPRKCLVCRNQKLYTNIGHVAVFKYLTLNIKFVFLEFDHFWGGLRSRCARQTQKWVLEKSRSVALSSRILGGISGGFYFQINCPIRSTLRSQVSSAKHRKKRCYAPKHHGRNTLVCRKDRRKP